MRSPGLFVNMDDNMDNDLVVKQMNARLAAQEEQLLQSFSTPSLPVLFIIGLPRSGTTLLTQLLIQRYRLGYINNIVAKFWEAPVVGANLMLSLRGKQATPSVSLDSSFGFTEELDGPHEFGYFWRRFFPFSDHHELEPDVLASVDILLLQREIAGLESVYQAPMLFKNPAALPLQTAFLSRALPTSVFLKIERDPESIAASLLKGRRAYTGSIQNWFSIKPRSYKELLDQSVYDQIAGQMFYTEKSMNQQLLEVPDHRQLSVSYHDLCEQPEIFFDRFEVLMQQNGTALLPLKTEMDRLSPKPAVFADPKEQQAMREALKKWELCE